jgi:hypothetical protein
MIESRRKCEFGAMMLEVWRQFELKVEPMRSLGKFLWRFHVFGRPQPRWQLEKKHLGLICSGEMIVYDWPVVARESRKTANLKIGIGRREARR